MNALKALLKGARHRCRQQVDRQAAVLADFCRRHCFCVSAVNATVRRVFDTSSNSWLELQWVLFSVVFLLCSPWTLLDNEHIRIDIVNNLLPQRVRNTRLFSRFALKTAIIFNLRGV